MPLVLVTDTPTLWESDYADIVGIQYEFPEQYRSYVLSGERFLYYRGSRGRGRGAVGYFGEGVVGDVHASRKPGHLIARVHDVQLFDTAVDIRDPGGNYWETGTARGTNWANGVRRIGEDVFEAISGAAASAGVPTEPIDPTLQRGNPAHASAIERYSVDVVMSLLAAEFGADRVREMPVNNPGFDIEVKLVDAASLHVEVKGTVLPAPVFHLSEGQRQHAELLGDRFRLIVVHEIDVRRRTHQVSSCAGPLGLDRATLQPASWTGVLTAAPQRGGRRPTAADEGDMASLD
ncbi:hypothetical protein GCM10028777_18110 [Angustibacter speluncae]